MKNATLSQIYLVKTRVKAKQHKLFPVVLKIKFTEMEMEFKCSICEKNHQNRRKLLLHMLNHKHKNQPKLNCNLCDKKFDLKSSFDTHEFLIHNRKAEDFKCNYCNKYLSCKSSLKGQPLVGKG